MLLLKRHLVTLVREGKKRQTIRLWTRPIVHAGQISYTPGLGRMKIISVEPVESLAALTEEDARADGFVNRAALLAEIKKIYGPHAASGTRASEQKPRTLFRITFEWPIDAAGEALVLSPAPVPGAAQHPTASVDGKMKTLMRKKSPRAANRVQPSAEKTRRQPSHASSPPATVTTTRHMSPAQRQALRSFILSRAPAA